MNTTPEREVLQWTMNHWVLAFLVPVIGWMMSYLKRLRDDGKEAKASVCFWLVDMFVAVMTGVISFIIVVGITDNFTLAAGIGGLMGHFGARILWLIEKEAERRLKELDINAGVIVSKGREERRKTNRRHDDEGNSDEHV